MLKINTISIRLMDMLLKVCSCSEILVYVFLFFGVMNSDLMEIITIFHSSSSDQSINAFIWMR